MAKIIRRGSAPPDHPIYSTGPEMFSPRAFSPSSKSAAPAADGVTQAKSASATEPPMDLQNLPFDPAEVVLKEQEEAYLLREAGASAAPSPKRSQ